MNENAVKVIDEYNKIAGSINRDDWNDDFAFPSMELAPNDKIRFSWKEFTGIEYGWQEYHKYLTLEKAEKELKNLKEDNDG